MWWPHWFCPRHGIFQTLPWCGGVGWGSIVKDLGQEGVKHLHLDLFPSPVEMGASMQVFEACC